MNRPLFLLCILTTMVIGCVGGRCDQATNEDACVTDWRSMTANQRVLCKKEMSAGRFRNATECKYGFDDPAKLACKHHETDSDEFKWCVWAYSHPLEARCKMETSTEDSYWKCMSVRSEQTERSRDRQQRQQIYDAEVSERRNEALQKAFQKPKTTTCISKVNYAGNVVTVCE